MLNFIEIIEVILPILIAIAFLTLAERKIMGSMQRRIGPNIIGIFGILQPIIDGLKLVFKEIIIPQQSNKLYFLLGPIIILILCLIIWIPIPFQLGETIYEIEYGVIYILAISSLSVYILLYSGWSSNSKYAIIGIFRSIAQLISYEVSIGIILMSVIVLVPNNSFNLNSIILSQIYISNIFPLFPIFLLFLISILAETNRPPFDLPEAESELIAGYIIEYGGISFAAIYLAEYGFILAMSSFCSILFFGFNYIPWGNGAASLPTLLIIYIFILVRAGLPRIRYDQLMSLGWIKILPFSISYFLLSSSILLTFHY